MIEALALTTPELGDRSYLLHDRNVGVVIDPQRDIERVLSAAAQAGVRVVCVAETHIHNDYVSGGWALSQLLGVPYLVAADESVSFERQAVRDGDEIRIGPSFSLRVMATPGHTPHHVSYVALENGRPASVCTGGSMLYGSAGRTDLFGPGHAAALAHHQYRSVQQVGRLPEWVTVLPTHGFGSFCAAGAATGVETSTVEEQRVENLAFRSGSEDAFVAALLSSFTAYPSYFDRMAARNLEGQPASDFCPALALNEGQLLAATRAGAWVVDVRPRTSFASAHLHRTVNIEHGMQFTTYLGWLLPVHTPLVLIGQTEETVARAQLDLTRIGIDHVAGRYVGQMPPPALDLAVRSYPVRRFVDLAQVRDRPGIVTLDVRRDDEWDAGHIRGAVHMPVHHLVEHADELPQGTIWVHCAAGFRAGIAASLLAREGRHVVLIDDTYATMAQQHRQPRARSVPRGESPRPLHPRLMTKSDRVGAR